MHPVWQMRAGMPARGNSREGVRLFAAEGSHRKPSSPSKPRWREFETLKYTLQVAPEDCTGCKLCVEICPVKSKSEVKHKALNMAPQASSAETEMAELGFLPVAAGTGSQQAIARASKGLATARATVRVLGCVRRMRRNTLHQVADTTVRRPPDDRECDGLFFDLWRKSADNAVHPKQGWTRADVVELAV